MRINTLLPAAALALACAAAAALSPAAAAPRPGAAAAADCDGDACSQVTLTFDDTKQQYRAQNNSQERWVRLSASNLSAAVNTCLGPGKALYLPLKSVVPPYRAAFAEVKCGEEQVGE
jgi:hypothetical protein